MSLGVVANVYNEAFALPGWLEMACSFFDDVRIYHSGPGGKCSDDGTVELLERWHIPYAVLPASSMRSQSRYMKAPLSRGSREIGPHT